MAEAKRDNNRVTTLLGTDNSTGLPTNLLTDNSTGRLLVNSTITGSVDVNLQDGAGTDLTSTSGALDVNIASGSSSGTQYDDGDADATPTGTVAMGTDGSNVFALAADTDGHLQVDVLSGSTSGTQYTEGDTDSSITGTAIMWEDGSETLRSVSAAKPLPVDLGSNNDVTVTGTVDLGSTDNAVLDTIASPVATISSTPLQRIAIFDDSDTQITSFGGGTQYTEADTDTTITGTAIMWEDGSDTLRAVSATKPLPVDLGSNNDVTLATLPDTSGGDLSAIATSLAVMDDWDESNRAKVNLIPGNVGIDAGAGSVDSGTPRVTLGSDDPAVTALQVIDNVIYFDDGDWSNGVSSHALVGGIYQSSPQTISDGKTAPFNMNVNGALHVAQQGTVTVDLGSNNDVTLATLPDTSSGDLAAINSAVSGTLTVGSHAVTNAGTFATQATLQTGSNAIGKLVANSGVDIGDVTINNSTGASAVNIQDGGNSITIDGTVTADLGSTDNAVLDTIASPVATISSTPLQRIAIFDDSDNQITSFGGGTQYAVDAALGSTPTGTLAVGIRDDALSSLTPVEGDAIGLRVDSTGALWVATDDTLTVDGSGSTQPISAASLPLPTGAATSANQSTIIGHVDGIETVLGTIDTDTGNIATSAGTVAGAVSGSEMQVDIVSDGADLLTNTNFAAAFGTAGSADSQVMSVQGVASMTPLLVDATGQGDIPITLDSEVVTVDLGANNDVTVTGTVTANLSATDNQVLDDIKVDTEAIETAVEAIQAAQLPDGHNVTIDNPGDIGGGTQYTEGDEDATITGTAMMMEVAADIVEPVQGTVAGGLLVNLGTNNDVTVSGVSTAANQTTIIGHLDGVETTLTAIDGRVDGVEALLTTIDADTSDIHTNSDAMVTDLAAIEALLITIDADTGNLPTIETNTDFGTVTGGGTETGALRVTLANNSTGVVSVDDNGSSITIDGTVTAELSATDNAVLDDIAADTESIKTAVEILDNAISGTEMQVDVVAALPAGTNAIGKLAANSGVDIGDVDVTSISAGANLIGDVGISGARTSGGTTPYKNLDVDESEDEVKGTAGQVYWIHAINTTTAPLYLKFYNLTAANTTVGSSTPVLTLPVPANADSDGAGFTLSVPNAIAFGTAITIAATTAAADADTGAPGAGALIVNLGYS